MSTDDYRSISHSAANTQTTSSLYESPQYPTSTKGPSTVVQTSASSSKTSSQAIFGTDSGSQSTITATSSSSESSKPSSSQSTGWLPDVIVTASAPDASTTSISVATTALPKAISPAATTASIPDDYTLITIGFKRSLNYVFVVENSISSAQIFEYLPDVLSYPFSSIDKSDVTVKQLVPYTSSQLSYIITIAEVYFPKSKLTSLQNELTTSGSKIYENPNSAQSTLANLIDSRIPIQGLLGSSSTSVWIGSNSDSSSGSGSSSVDPQSLGSMDFSSEANSSVGKSSTSGGKMAGIIAGSAVGAGAYLSAIVAFYIRRKNRKQKQDQGMTEEKTRPRSNFESYCSPYDGSSFESYNPSYSYSGSGNMGDIRLSVGCDREPYDSEDSAYYSSAHTSRSFRNSGSQHSIPSISAPINLKNSLGW